MFHGDGTAPCFDCYRPAHVLIVGTKNQHFVFQSPKYTYIYIYTYIHTYIYIYTYIHIYIIIYIYISYYIMIHTKKMPFLTSSSSRRFGQSSRLLLRAAEPRESEPPPAGAPHRGEQRHAGDPTDLGGDVTESHGE